MIATTKPKARHHSTFPWPEIHTPPHLVGTRVCLLIHGALAWGAVSMRRRGHLKGEDSKVLIFEGPPFTRDAAGLYLLEMDAGGQVFAHESEVRT